MSVVITTIYASLGGLLIVAQGLAVSRLRRSRRISLGDGDDRQLRKAIRLHANSTENIPIAMLLLLLCELGGGSTLLLHICGAVFILARLAHHYGIAVGRGGSPPRVFGMAGSWIIIIVLAVYNLVLAFG